MLNTNKDLKIYYSASEVAAMYGVPLSTLRFWEKEFPQLKPRKVGGRAIRQYRKEDVETFGLIYHLVEEKGLTLKGARQRLESTGGREVSNYDLVERLRSVKAELLAIRKELDGLPSREAAKGRTI